MAIIDVLSSGTLGFFWDFSKSTLNLETESSERGYAKTEGGWTRIDLLDEHPWTTNFSDQDDTEAIVGVLEEEAALFLEITQSGTTHRFGGDPRASTKHYLARTAIGGVPPHLLRTFSLLNLQAHFHGIGEWAGMNASHETPRTERGRMTAWSVELSGGEDFSHDLPGKRSLLLSTTWEVTGPPDERGILAPVVIGCQAKDPVDLWHLLQPILQVQDLLGFAFDGFIAARGGSAGLDTEEDITHRVKSTLWNGALMVPHPGTLTGKTREFPLFDLDCIGGIAGLARWIRMSSTHPRATAPMVIPYRFGRVSAATAVMELAAAIEYWVKANRPAVWASGGRYAERLALRCGKSFSQWSGNPTRWARAFWDTNNRLKHEPTFTPDPMELADLAASARYVLGAALLNRVAGSSKPSQAIFSHFRLHSLSQRLQDRYS